MGIPVLIIGKSGSGKSTSLRNCSAEEFGVINVLNKPLPFRTKLRPFATKDYATIKSVLKKSKTPSVVIDDAGYLITDYFMSNHSTCGAGNAVFTLYNKLGDDFYDLFCFIVTELPADKIVYLFMHEDRNDMGEMRPKTIGKMLDEKVTVEGLVSITLRCVIKEKNHLFLTNAEDEYSIEKSPIGMFETVEIENDLKFVDQTIREYWELAPANNESEEE